MKQKALAIANNDLVYLWWTFSEKIPNCLGFTIHRLQEGKPTVALPAFVGFEPPKRGSANPSKRSTTDYWPIQSYQWKDLFVPEETEVEYEIVPVTGTPGQKLVEIPGLTVRTSPIKASDVVGLHRVVFNRGIISTQSLTEKLPKGRSGTPSGESLRDHIGKPGGSSSARASPERRSKPSQVSSIARSATGEHATVRSTNSPTRS